MNKPDIGPFMMGIGAFLLAWGILGWFGLFAGTVEPGTATNVLNAVTGVLFLWLGYAGSPNIRHDWATKTGLVFAALGILGFVLGGRAAPNVWLTDLSTLESSLYLVIGVLLFLGGRRILTEDFYVVPPRYRFLMATRAVRK